MASIKSLFKQVYRDFQLDGVAASGRRDPAKSEIRAIGAAIEQSIGNVGLVGSISVLKDTKANLDADLDHPADTIALTYADETDTNNDISIKVGASGAGAWALTTIIHDVIGGAGEGIVTEARGAAEYVARGVAADQHFSIPATIGECDGGYGGTVAAGIAYGVGFHFLQRARLVGFKVATTGAGTIAIARALRSTDAAKHSYSSAPLAFAVAGAGISIYDEDDIATANDGQPFIFEPGELAMFSSDAGVKMNPTREPYYVSTTIATPGVPATMLFSSEAFGASIAIELYVMLAPPQRALPYCVLEDIQNFSESPCGWRYLDAAPTYADGAATLAENASGASAGSFYSGRPYGLDRRRIEMDVQFGTVDAQLQWQTNPVDPFDSQQYEGSLGIVEADTGQYRTAHRWDGGGGYPALDTVALNSLSGAAMPIAADHTYRLTIEKDYRDYRVSLSDPSGSGCFVLDVSNDQEIPAGGTTTYGMLHGAPGLKSLNDTVKLLSFRHIALYSPFPVVAIFGDSLTEGLGIELVERWGSALADKYGAQNVAISGVGGSNSAGVLMRMHAELEGMRPQVVVIPIGANSGDAAGFAANMKVAIRLARNAGAKVVLATIPASGVAGEAATKSASIAGLGADAVIDFGKAMTDAGPGTTPIAAYYQADNLHWLGLGNQRAYVQATGVIEGLLSGF